MALLEIENLSVSFGGPQTPLIAVESVDLAIDEGEVVGVVGESGSGKSVSSLAIMGLIDPPGRVSAQRMVLAGRNLLTISTRERRSMLGQDVAMIFQDPMASLNPCFTVAHQLMETLAVHVGGSANGRRGRALELLRQVDMPDPERRLNAYPHQLSGGMSQRVMVAMAIACNPRLLIADEPTTALDVTIQAQLLDLLLALQKQRGMALLLITHDLGVVAQTAQRVVVMYAGQVVETGALPRIFEAPRHPYTQALLAALPENNVGRQRLQTIPGTVPGQFDRPTGCLLQPRCAFAAPRCIHERPALAGEPGNLVRCHFPLDGAAR